MKAVLVARYGSPEVIQVGEAPVPQPKKGEILVRVRAGAVNTADARTRGLKAPGIAKPVMQLLLGFGKPRQPILGTVFAGTVESLGEGVTQFQPGDAVFGSSPGLRYGCHAQYATLPAAGPIAIKPASMSFEQAAALPFGGNTALFFLEKHHARAGESILVNGAAGAVGSMAVQIARIMGLHVTGVASGKNEALVRELGAERFIDYTNSSVFDAARRYDLILDTVGKLDKARAKTALAPGGRFINLCGAAVAKDLKRHVEKLAKWFEEGKIKAVIHSAFPMENARDAHRIVDSGHKRGSVILLMDHKEASQ